MKLTKLQRYTAYCIMEQECEDTIAMFDAGYWRREMSDGMGMGGLCDLLDELIGYNDKPPMKALGLSELIAKQPTPNIRYYWFNNNKEGWQQRIKLLKQCIIETHPQK